MSAPIGKDLVNLNESQRQAVLAEGHLLCCAGPGSGKTRVLTEKVAHILTRAPSDRIVLATFSREAAHEMRTRIGARLPRLKSGQVTIGTFNSLGLQQLKGAHISIRVLSPIEIRHLVFRACHDVGLDLDVMVAEEEITLCKTDPAYAAAHPDMLELARAYQRRVNAQRACDFTDMLLRTVALMKKGTLAPMPADWILCDEFQDVDRLQYEWLAAHVASGATSCVVGDDDQSVYGFRRALGYAGMMNYASMTKAAIVNLGVNYRSTDQILASATRLIATNPNRVPKEQIAARGRGPIPHVVVTRDSAGQIDLLIQRLDHLCTAPPAPPVEGGVPYRFGVLPGQVAILTRTNDHLRAVEKAFVESRIPYVRSGRNFWQDKAVQAMLALLGSFHSKDGVGLEIALRWAGVPDSIGQELLALGGGSLTGLLKPGTYSARWPGGPVVESLFQNAPNWVSKNAAGRPQAAIYGVAGWMTAVLMETCGVQIDDQTTDASAIPKKRPAAVDCLELARDILADRFTGSLAQRLRMAQQDDRRKDLPRIVLATFHASKGLEFDHVFLLDVVEGIVPSKESVSAEELAEERRIFYVAMTRAADSLTIFTRPKDKVSRFLYEAGLHVE
ncbi:MAG: ATP-dependent helicase [Sulfuritalea sp.]|nr:ATP-dependent helicase [Sulfuritalea sp.]